MPYILLLLKALKQAGWKVKIHDSERLEPPHVTIYQKMRKWRLSLRDGKFLDRGDKWSSKRSCWFEETSKRSSCRSPCFVHQAELRRISPSLNLVTTGTHCDSATTKPRQMLFSGKLILTIARGQKPENEILRRALGHRCGDYASSEVYLNLTFQT